MEGHILIGRDLFSDVFWREDRKYSRFEAWIDLFQAARFADGVQLVGKYQRQYVKRGQLVASVRRLAEQWQWSTKRVWNFLGFLEAERRIAREASKEAGITIITILNYDELTKSKGSRETPLETAKETPKETVKETGVTIITSSNCDDSTKSKSIRETPKETLKDTLKETAKETVINKEVIIKDKNISSRTNVLEDCLYDTNQYKLKKGGYRGGTWRDDFQIYLEELRIAYKTLCKDDAWLETQKRFNPKLNILLTLEKACVNYWATEEGWNRKLKQHTKTINWRQTLTKALSLQQNKVYNDNGGNKKSNNGVSDDYKERIRQTLLGGSGYAGMSPHDVSH